MWLSDRDLKILDKRQNIIEPFIEDNCEGATINLTLDPKIKKYVSKDPIVLGSKMTEDRYEEIDITQSHFFLDPSESVLVKSHEYFRIPDNMAALILERYSIKLLGLYISPASFMNPGYEGNMSFLAVNHTNVPIQLTAGIKFCQLAIYELSTEAEKPYHKQDAKYLGSQEVNISKLHLDKDIQEFLKNRGIENVSEGLASELGAHLMKQIRTAADKIADEVLNKVNGKISKNKGDKIE